MNLVTINIADIKRAEYNPHGKSEHVLQSIRQSIREYGFLQPIVVNTHECERCGSRKNVLVAGHRRIEALEVEGTHEVPAVLVNLHLEDEKRANLRLNAQETFMRSELAALVAELHSLDAAKTATLGFDPAEITRLLFENRYAGNKLQGILQEKFLIPPFSIFDAKQGYWQKRKRQWLDFLGDCAETREDTLAGGKNNLLMRGVNKGVSIFDPVVSEVVFSWFLPEGGVRVLDPFAGSLARGGVATALGLDYTGIEIRKEQIQTNEQKLAACGLAARYIHADSRDLSQHIPNNETFDLVFTSPPYYDLEEYSSLEGDLSKKKTYKEFLEGYGEIFAQSTKLLKPNRFVVIEIGDIRDEHGFYRNFIGDNITLFRSLGFHLYNEIIYVQMLATAPHRAERNMRKRKVVKTHQNILTFYSGDPSLLKNPRLLEAHEKVLVFFNGDTERIKVDYRNPPPIRRDIVRDIGADDGGTE